MAYSFVEKKNIRKFFIKKNIFFKMKSLLNIQKKSYQKFLQFNINPSNRKNIGLQLIFNSMFPVYSLDKLVSVNFISYSFKKPALSLRECKNKKKTFSISLQINICLIFYEFLNNKKRIKNIREQIIYITNIPLMTNTGSFIINGIEKVVISQFNKSPGVFYEKKIYKNLKLKKTLFSSTIIPIFGSWLKFEFDKKNILYFRINKSIKIPITILLNALGMNTQQIISFFFNYDIFYLKNGKYKILLLNIKKNKKKLLNQNILLNNNLLNRVIAKNIKNNNNEILFKINDRITKKILFNININNIKYITTINTNINKHNICILNSLNLHKEFNKFKAYQYIYNIIYLKKINSKSILKLFFKNLFFNNKKYNLSFLGRLKINKEIYFNNLNKSLILSKKDILYLIKKLINFKKEKRKVHDIDHLENKYVSSVGDLIAERFRTGMSYVIKNIEYNLNHKKIFFFIPENLINTKIISSLINKFFNTSQLCQFLDQTNILSEITHKRRISNLGPRGLAKERAGFDIRDIHKTYYGKICPIETPEGPSIGLVNSLAIYANINKYNILETPYLKIKKCFISGEIKYLSSLKEERYIISNKFFINNFNKNNNFKNIKIFARKSKKIINVLFKKVEYMDIDFNQILSIGVSLIPFIEHNDANRALMGANMQRQSLACINPKRPLIATGMEKIVAIDSGTMIKANNSGIVCYVDSTCIIINTYNKKFFLKKNFFKLNFDNYYLIKYDRSNQGTLINQRPIVNLGDFIYKSDIIADGVCTDLGELSLGQNVLVAFMPWYGYNFEDSIIISEKIISKDKYTSLHIEEFSVNIKNTKLGPEKTTKNILNLSNEKACNLDSNGIIKIGSKIKTGNVLVGKITPVEKKFIFPEERLLQAIFGEKINNVKDTSFKTPNGIEGTVIDVSILFKKKKDEITKKILKNKLKKYIIFLKYHILRNKSCIYKILENKIINQEILNFSKVLKNKKLTKNFLYNIKKKEWFNFNFINKNINKFLNLVKILLFKQKKNMLNLIKIKKKKIFKKNKLPDNVIKIIKIKIIIKKQLQLGDKMSGRHGNKGVISKILPIEDMPYMSNGEIVDVILNPLGIPSRMNVGQLLEVHLGWASKGLGDIIKKILLKNIFNFNKIRNFLNKIYNTFGRKENLNELSNNEIIELLNILKKGVPFGTPSFKSIKEKNIFNILNIAYNNYLIKKLNINKLKNQISLYDGKTGIIFDRPITVGYMYFLKLNHLVDNKIHARSIGPYSLITQQPLKGKSKFGGQRFGEMEVWALEAYGAAYTLKEMLTIKSDDIKGRNRIYKNLINGIDNVKTGIPESFKVLLKELMSLCIDINLKKK